MGFRGLVWGFPGFRECFLEGFWDGFVARALSPKCTPKFKLLCPSDNHVRLQCRSPQPEVQNMIIVLGSRGELALSRSGHDPKPEPLKAL